MQSLMSDMSPEDREYINTCTNAIILICDMIETFTMDFNQVLKKYHPDYRLEMYDKIMQVGKEAKAHVQFMSECTDNVYQCSGAATAGNYGAATAGDSGAATAGNYGAATSRGSSSTGNNGLAVARGTNVKVRGGMGSILVIAEEQESSYNVSDWKAVVVDGKNIKADTWYRLVDGEFVEVEY